VIENGRARDQYAEALAILPPSGGGGCHAALLGVANRGRIAGLKPERVFDDLRARVRGTRDVTNEEIMAAVNKAFVSDLKAPARERRARPRVNGTAARDRIIKAGAGTTMTGILERSPVAIDWPADQDAARFLLHMYRPDELVFLGDDKGVGSLGGSIRPAIEWVERFACAHVIPYPKIMANPLTGQIGLTKNGAESYRADSCVSAHRYVICEFDQISLDEQSAFWAACPRLPVAAIIFSGKKSLHAWVRVDCTNKNEWEAEIENKLFPEILVPLGLDGACKNESRLSRLPGHIRSDTGLRQHLVYLCPQGKAVSE